MRPIDGQYRRLDIVDGALPKRSSNETTAGDNLGLALDLHPRLIQVLGSRCRRDGARWCRSASVALAGGDGDDVVSGGEGDDAPSGGAGNDTVNGDDAPSVTAADGLPNDGAAGENDNVNELGDTA